MLVAEDIHFAYKGQSVFHGLNLTGQEGELVGIVGPNGAGKTTILKLISGVLKPSLGRITINGTDLATLNGGERAKLVSAVPQNPLLPVGFRAVDLVLMGRNPYLKLFRWEGVRDLEIAREVMKLTHTWHLADRFIGSLSGGERQRALVAMALAQEAPLLLLDEPTSSLDLAHQTGIMDLVRDLQQQRGGTVLLAMHDLTLAAQYCDRLVLLEEGRTYAAGPPEVVLTRENIARVYGAEVAVLPHPQDGTPVVLPLTGRRNHRNDRDEPS